MKLRKIFAAATVAAVVAAMGAAAPASAAPSSYAVPSACQGSLGKTLSASKLASYGATVKAADLHPRAGNEYAYVLNCTNGVNTKPRPVIVLASGSGSVLAARTLVGDYGRILNATRTGGISVSATETYGGVVSHDRTVTAKYNNSTTLAASKTAVPGWVVATSKLVTQMDQGKKLTAVSGTSTIMNTLTAYGKKYAAVNSHNAYCDRLSSTSGKCTIVYYKGNKGYYRANTLVKSGTGWKVTKSTYTVATSSGG